MIVLIHLISSNGALRFIFIVVQCSYYYAKEVLLRFILRKMNSNEFHKIMRKSWHGGHRRTLQISVVIRITLR